MDSITIRFEVMIATERDISFKGQTYKRARFIGFLLDEFGSRVACTADLAYEGKISHMPKPGENVRLVLAGLSTRGAMVEATFMDVLDLPANAKKSA